MYDGIPADAFGGTRPPIFLGKVPQTTAAAAQQRLPYVCLTDLGFRPEFDSSAGGIERGEIRLEVFALKLGGEPDEPSVDRIADALKWGGATPKYKKGLDFGAIALTGYTYPVHLMRKSERRDYAGFDYQGARVHMCELRYAVMLGLSPA